MSTRFDYAAAWRGLAAPAVEGFNRRQLLCVKAIAPKLEDKQQESDLNIKLTVEIRHELDKLTTPELAEMSRACDKYGHWMPSVDQMGDYRAAEWFYPGAGWKVANVADQIIRERLNFTGTSAQVHQGQLRVIFSSRDCWMWEEFGLAIPENIDKFRAAHSEGLAFSSRTIEKDAEILAARCGDMWDTSKYMVHEKGTQYSDEELAQELRIKGIPVLNIIACNYESPNQDRYKPHQFTIGAAHMKGNSMYLDPSSAPCAHCHGDYRDHTHKRAAIFAEKPEVDIIGRINQVIDKLNNADKAAKIKHIDAAAYTQKEKAA